MNALPVSTLGSGLRSSRRAFALGAVTALGALATSVGTGGARRIQVPTGEITVSYDESDVVIAAVVEAARAAILEAAPDAVITVEPGPAGNFQTQLFLALSSGRGPDVFIMNGLGIGELGAAGFLMPLDPYLEAWDGWAHYSDLVRSSIQWQGTTWALPSVVDTHFLYYRKDLFEQAGLAREWQPSTPGEILETARVLKDALPDVPAYALHAGANGGTSSVVRGFLPLTYAFGGQLQDDQGRFIIDSCAIREALGYYATAYQVDETVPRQAMTAPNVTAMLRDSLAAGELAMLYDGSWVYGTWSSTVPDIAANEVGYALFPRMDGAPFAMGGIGASWYMNAKAASPDLAFALIAAANAVEAQVSMNTASPHIPARDDAAADPAFASSPFLEAMIASASDLVVAPPDPGYRQLVGVVQNVTGMVATGEASPDEAVTHYADEMERILGADRVVAQPCS